MLSISTIVIMHQQDQLHHQLLLHQLQLQNEILGGDADPRSVQIVRFFSQAQAVANDIIDAQIDQIQEQI